ncbi:MAG TPA: SBBP repeat-containing protein [Bacteroidia bacterium]|jgi:hypothetical protein|nr:SBBP repeat-containing protein [Bacteroidia bacterium]
MKSIILMIGTFLATCNCFSQTANYQWAKNIGSTNEEVTKNIATDPAGNVYVTGFFRSASITIGTTTLVNNTNGSADMFIAKYDANGNELWAKSSGGNNYEEGTDVATDASGNVYVTGYISSATVSFDTINLSNYYNGNHEMFVVKYNPSGNILWAKCAGRVAGGMGISTDANGNIYVTGQFGEDSMNIGSLTLYNQTYGNGDVFLIKYDANGSEIWARSGDGGAGDFSNDVSVDMSGNIFITGYFSSPSFSLDTVTLINASNSNDLFIAKYDSSGNIQWARRASGSSNCIGESVATDNNGKSFVTGQYGGTSLTFGSLTITNTAGSEGVVVAFDSSGNSLWLKGIAGGPSTSDVIGWSIATDNAGNVYVGGAFYNPTLQFGSTALTNADASGSTSDGFVLKYDGFGNEFWAIRFGNTSSEIRPEVEFDNMNNLFIGASYSSTTLALGSLSLTNAGYYDAFVSKISSVTAVNENSSPNYEVNIYPNPFSGLFTLRTDFNSKYSVEIFNSLGQEAFRKENENGNNFEIDLSDQPAGIFYISIFCNGKIYSQKVLKE